MTILNLNVIIYLKLLTLEEVKTMKYFLIEGIVTHPERMTNEMMQEHQKYTNLLMKAGKVLFSSLKSCLLYTSNQWLTMHRSTI